MSFIPHRDVFALPDDILEQLAKLFDEVEEEFTLDYVKDEMGSDATIQGWIDHYGGHPCPHFGAWSMLVYLYGQDKLRI